MLDFYETDGENCRETDLCHWVVSPYHSWMGYTVIFLFAVGFVLFLPLLLLIALARDIAEPFVSIRK